MTSLMTVSLLWPPTPELEASSTTWTLSFETKSLKNKQTHKQSFITVFISHQIEHPLRIR